MLPPVIPATLRRLRQKNHLNPEAEVAVGRDWATGLQPGHRAILCQERKGEENYNDSCFLIVIKFSSHLFLL